MDKQTQKELLAIVKNNYAEIVEHFAQTRKKKAAGELEKIIAQVEDGAKVLDVGCGSGRLLRLFGEKKINYLGLDACPQLLEKAKEEFKKNNLFVTGDILNLSDNPEYNFDYVFSIAVLHHLPGKDLRLKALKQLKNKIKENGKIIISVWNMWEQNRFIKLAIKFFFLKLLGKNKMDFGDIVFDYKNSNGSIRSRRYYHAFTKRQLKKLAKLADLKIEKIFSDKFNYYLILTK